MKTLFDHLENIKGKPRHVRKRIAFGSAIGGTSLVALVWLVASLSAGAFAIQGSSFATSAGQGSLQVAGASNMNSGADKNLAGAAAALTNDSSLPARIEIVNVASSSPVQGESERTILPF
ncbi:hypothetical protein A2678_03440 [Candidatus Kaiserbacteria bacterium RIFCSPHIGHO2_01_FULL_53_31]|uniref:Uncharacterized protein n=1 Tax=Candidatus Kaiserbacteria bacterium RIFCSPHIGHO2_01_FULL_53_31 TaxID=1798481 RepID=A0A1F6CI44_9BACT|nr:MAG: hypothetical protein A2678_03440 [Candidatus Kaiserbacteria bacterium RIFCSPHIGHO2_01_FULL_53_31]